MGDNSDPTGNAVSSRSSESDEERRIERETSIASAQNGIGLINLGQRADGNKSRTEDINNFPMNSPTVSRRADEYEVDFSDTRDFAAWRWHDIIDMATKRLSPDDCAVIATSPEWSNLVEEIQSKLTSPASTAVMKRLMTKIYPLPRFLSFLTGKFAKLIVPREVNFEFLWGILFLNLKLSYGSLERLTRTCDWLFAVRRVIELFNKCLDTCEEMNEARLTVIDFFDPLVTLAVESVVFLHETLTDEAAAKAGPEFKEKITTQISALDSTVRHLSDITNYSKVNQDRKVKNMSLRHALMPESEETAAFPIKRLPFLPNPRFYGRQEELEKIIKYLSPKGDQSLRTYTIYGRRGVGKTEIALECANSNAMEYDAIFWIQCETSVSIRQSFTDVAVALNLPSAHRDGQHEENLLGVQDWLKKTQRRWLLIFDNAENDQIIKAYWPVGTSGAILITSRKYYNFAKDGVRRGDTIKPFTPAQSWDLFLKYLGDDWRSRDRKGLIEPSEIAAAKGLLAKLEGLALAILQAANLVMNPNIGGSTMATNFAMFKDRMQTLPERHWSERSSSEHALDALWDMVFSGLSRNARILLGVLSWLSPDAISAELFLPRDERALDGSLSFCKEISHGRESANRTTLTPGLETAIEELLENKLIRRDGRMISIHRVVQEATNYHDVQDLQDSFNNAVRLVYEAFPGKDRYLRASALYSHWSQCQLYIPHGVFLSKKFFDYERSGKLEGSEIFSKLLANCAWYLLELSDYEVCWRVLDAAKIACTEKDSILYADLRNTSGSCYYELNRVTDCRRAWEETYRIRQKLLPHDHILIGSILQNLGNLESTAGNLHESLGNFEKSQLITANSQSHDILAKIFLGIARINYLQYRFDLATKMVIQAEMLVVRNTGADKGLMVHVYYTYGNIDLIQKRWEHAWRAYDNCLKIALAETPISPITAAAYYSLACVEFEMGRSDPARNFLEKARTIAELRSPTRDDGVIARILWKLATVLESDTYGRYVQEASELRNRAELARATLLAKGEGGFIPLTSEDNLGLTQEEDDFDSLVPLYFR